MRFKHLLAGSALAFLITPGFAQDQPASQGETTTQQVPQQAQPQAGGQQSRMLMDAQNQLQQAAQQLQEADQQNLQQAQQQAQQALDNYEQALQQHAQSGGQQAQDQVEQLQPQIEQARQQLQQSPQEAGQTLQQIAQSGQQMQGGDQTASVPQPELSAEADRLVGKKVMGSDGEETGEIADALVSPDGKIEAVLVETGGALGVGGKQVAVAWDQIQVEGDQMKVNMTSDQLDQMPEYVTE